MRSETSEVDRTAASPRAVKRPPGPTGLPYIGNLEAYEEDRLAFLALCARDYGDVAAYDDTVFVVSRADLVERILTRTNREYAISQDLFRRELKDIDIPSTTAVRRAMAIALRGSSVLRYAPRVVTMADSLASGWSARGTVCPEAELEWLTGRAMADYCFGADGERIPDLTRTLLDALVPISSSPFVFPTWLPTPRTLRAQLALGRLRWELNRIINSRRASGEPGNDALGALLSDASERDAPIRRIRAALVPVLVASLRVPAAALSWAMYLLALNEATQNLVRAEADRVLTGAGTSSELAERLPYTSSVVREVLRLYPPTWLSDRRVILEDELDGFRVQPGYRIVFSPYVIHRDPRYYRDPECFRPERWTTGETRNLPDGAYVPFGAGPRGCIGPHFALMEITVALATIVRRLRIRLDPGSVVTPDVKNTMVPAGLRVTVVDVGR